MSVSNGKLLAMVAGLWLVLIVGGSYLLVTRILPGSAAAASGPAEAEAAVVAPGPMYVVKERVVNLTDAGGRRYVKIAMSIEFETGAAEFRRASPEERRHKQAEFEKGIALWVPVIEDAVIGLVSARSSAEIATPEGKMQLKNDIKESINRHLGGDRVANVYFTQFVMQ